MGGVRRIALLLGAALACVGALGARPQAVDEAERARTRVAKFRAYLERAPYHERSFDGLVEAAVAVNELEALVADYEARLEREPEADAARIVLARLLARTGQAERALELLAPLEQAEYGLALLRGALALERGAPVDALPHLESAAALAEGRAELEAALRARGAAFLALGERNRAAEAFHALAELDPESLELRLAAAEALADHGLAAEALREYEAAERLAGEDAARRCRVLAEIGRLHESLSDAPRAIESYEAALEQTARGNWLKRDLTERLLELHRRAGRLEELAARAGARAAAHPQDVDARELAARALELAGRREEARDLLRAATADFPADLELSRRLRDTLAALEDTDGLVAEYQRVLAARPEELELYVELGRLFAAEGRLAQARLQWTRTLERRLGDPSLCGRLASLYALYDMADDAVAMHERAIALEPAELRHYADLCALLAARDRGDALTAALERAEGAAGEDPGRLVELSALLAEHGAAERARAALERALALRPDDGRVRRRLAELLLEAGETERAVALLHEVVEGASEPGLRAEAVDRIVRAFRVAGRVEQLVALEEQAIAAGGDVRAPYLVLARALVQARAIDRAVPVLEALLERAPDDAEAREDLARLYEQRGEPERALAELTELAARRPQARRQYLVQIARIHLERFDQERAFACYDEILRGSPDNPAAFREVAQAYERLGLHEERRRCLEQAVRLAPDDARLRLELALAQKRLGEWDRARDEIGAAVRSGDEALRDQARGELYRLLTETGGLEAELERLRARVEQNPYDVEAPLALCDLYVRELEYELALALLDRLLELQPRERALLEQRARIRGLMERHDEAIADLEALLRLPDTDREQLALEIGAQAMLQGDLDRAREVLAGVDDVTRAAARFAAGGLPDEAIAMLEAGAERDPRDARLLARLARLREQVGDREGAAVLLERVLELEGDRWSTLLRLGDLEHALGRGDGAAEVGRRLFALVRVEEPEQDAADDDDQARSAPPALGYVPDRGADFGARQVAQRVDELRRAFERWGELERFVELAAEEARLQPSSAPLVDELLQAVGALDARRALARDVLRELGARCAETGRHPGDRTLAGWLDDLRRRELALYARAPELAEERAAELAAAAAPGPLELAERAHLLRGLRREAEALEVLRAGLAAHPDSARLAAGLAELLAAAERHEEAAAAWARAIALAAAGDADAEDAAERELAFAQRRAGLLQGFPVHVQRRVEEPQLRRLFTLTSAWPTASDWTPGGRLRVAGLRRLRAASLFELGRDDEARAELLASAPPDSDDVRGWAALARALTEREQHAAAEPLQLRLLALEDELERDPVLGFNRVWASGFAGPKQDRARLLERRGDVLGAYDLLRSAGAVAACELLVTTHDAWDALQAELERRAAAALGPDESADETAWRNARIGLAELCQWRRRWDDALAVYEDVAARLEHDFEVLDVIAALHLRAGRVDAALAVREEILEGKREENRRPWRPEAPSGRRLAPTPPVAAAAEPYGLRSLRYNYGGPRAARHDLRAEYVEILKIHLDARRLAEAADVLRRIAREDASALRYLAHSLRQLVQSYQLGEDALPILRLAYSYNPDDSYSALEYGRSLFDNQRLEEARRVFARLADDGRLQSYYRDQAAHYLEQIAARLGDGADETLDLLRAAVAAEPRNARLRKRLARRLLDERAFEPALAEAREAAALAPHLADVRQLLMDCLQVCGREAELEELLRERVARASGEDERFPLLVRLADRMWARGEDEAVEALFREHADLLARGQGQYSASAWFLQQGDLERAEALLREELERLGKDHWLWAEARARLDRLLVLRGEPLALLDRHWEAALEDGSMAAKAAALGPMAGALRSLPDLDAVRAEVFASAERHGGARGTLYRLALLLAEGDAAGAERALAAAVAADPELAFLVPAQVTLARSRGDLRAALAALEALEHARPPSETERVSTPLGPVSERDALRAEQGSLLVELGEVEAGRARWEQAFDRREAAGRGALARLYELHGMHAEAAELLQAALEESGERRSADLVRLAEQESAQGHDERALALYERALILAGSDADQRALVRARIHAGHRAAGRLDALCERLERELAADPADDELRAALATAALELGRDELALRCVEELVPGGDAQRAGAMTALLARLQLEAGREQAALDVLRAAVEERRASSNDRQRYGRALAAALLERGEQAEALAALEAGYADVPPERAAQAAAAMLFERERYADALPLLEEAARVSPDDSWLARQRLRALAGLGRHEQLFALTLERLADPDEDPYGGETRAALARAVEALGLEPALEARAAADVEPVDLEAHLALCALAAARCEWARCAERSEALLARLPGQRAAELFRLEALRALGRDAAAGSARLELIEAYDRERGVFGQSWPRERRLQALVDEHRQQLLVEGRSEALVESFRRPPGQRNREVQTYAYTYYNSPLVDGAAEAGWYWQRGMYAEFLACEDSWRLFADWDRDQAEAQRIEALFRLGEAERALEQAWQLAVEDDAGVVQELERQVVEVGGTGVDSVGRTLVSLSAEAGRLEDLIERLEQERAARGGESQTPLLLHALGVAERWERLAELRAEGLAAAPDSLERRAALAAALRCAGRHAEALEQYRLVIARRRAELSNARVEDWQAGAPAASGTVRFAWGGAAPRSSTIFSSTRYTYDPSAGDASLVGARLEAMALHAALGEPDEARRLEQALWRAALSSGSPRGPRARIAQTYQELGLLEEAERVQLALAESDPAYEPWTGLAAVFAHAGDAPRAARYGARAVAALDRELERDPWSVRTLVQRAMAHVEWTGDLEAARADAERAARLAGATGGAELALGWVALEAGRPDEALARFREAEARARVTGSGLAAPELLYGLGLALAAVEGRRAAAPVLRRALVSAPKNRSAGRARQVLE